MKNLEPEPLVFTRPDRIVCDISWAKKRGVKLQKIKPKYKPKYKQKKRNRKR
ncbi:hypothetical protein [Capnocytophaga cynodegmi]|uniref:hypothetical protein n=1 Tax=Capnocytophaga cynodegmi TaxID=28189 RepID=UPI001EE1B5E2|nr:hypothetical protein [Capnocytophaga cynodegmi]